MNEKTNEYYHKIDQKHYLQTFKRYPLTFEKGQGSRMWDVEGKEYIDALAGIAVNSLGHNHPKVVKAIQDQAAKLLHISNFYLSKPQVALSQKLTELSGLERVFFSNSGAESVEGAIKIARKYAHSIGRGGHIISFEGSFHGRTLATIATGKEKMQKGFGPMPEGFTRVPFNDFEAVKAAANEQTAAIILEPIQGEGGINVAEKSFLQSLRQFCDQHNIVLIFDEIQCGVGRTGHWFAKDYFGIQPDIMTLAKALGAGVPIGAILSNAKVSNAIDFGDHGTTFGGNPLVCAASLACINTMEEENLLEHAKSKGEWFKEQINNMDLEGLQEVRGLGLMLGVAFDFETKELVADMMHKGVLANATAGNVLRLLPALNIPKQDLEKIIAVIAASLKSIKTHA